VAARNRLKMHYGFSPKKNLVLDDHQEELKALIRNLEDAAKSDPSSFWRLRPSFKASDTAVAGIVEQIKTTIVLGISS